MDGCRVCRFHGGRAPQTVEAARRRLLAAADPAAARLELMLTKAKANDGDAIKAAIAILDRAGLGATSKTEVSGPGGAPLQVELLRYMTTSELEQVQAIYAAAQKRLDAGTEPEEAEG